MTKVMTEYQSGLVSRFVDHPEVKALLPLDYNLSPAVAAALLLISKEIFLCDRELAERWTCSVELLQKLRRIKRGPRFVHLSAGLIRISLYDVLTYEEENRRSAAVPNVLAPHGQKG